MPTHCHMSLLGSSRLLGSLSAAARRARADQTLIACQRGGQTTLRFANGRFHQNFHAESVEVWVKAACDGHVGISTTNAVSPEALRHAVDAAITIAKTGGHRHRTRFHPRPGRPPPPPGLPPGAGPAPPPPGAVRRPHGPPPDCPHHAPHSRRVAAGRAGRL